MIWKMLVVTTKQARNDLIANENVMTNLMMNFLENRLYYSVSWVTVNQPHDYLTITCSF